MPKDIKNKSDKKNLYENKLKMASSQFDEMWEKVMTGEQNTLI